MATQLTPNRQIRYDDLPDSADAKRLGQNLATDLDNVANIYVGTLAARDPATAAAGHGEGNPGSFYYSTDTAEVFVSIAGAWIKITTEPGIPLGGLIEYGGTGDPSDSRYLLADGRELARTGTYAPLFTVIGTAHGAGNGTTTFNIPDKRGRVAVGPDNMGTAKGDAARMTANDALGQSAGAEKHTLLTAEMPSHSHTEGVTMNIFTGAAPAAGVTVFNSNLASQQTGLTGGGGAHNNMPPYQIMNTLIRVK